MSCKRSDPRYALDDRARMKMASRAGGLLHRGLMLFNDPQEALEFCDIIRGADKTRLVCEVTEIVGPYTPGGLVGAALGPAAQTDALETGSRLFYFFAKGVLDSKGKIEPEVVPKLFQKLGVDPTLALGGKSAAEKRWEQLGQSGGTWGAITDFFQPLLKYAPMAAKAAGGAIGGYLGGKSGAQLGLQAGDLLGGFLAPSEPKPLALPEMGTQSNVATGRSGD